MTVQRGDAVLIGNGFGIVQLVTRHKVVVWFQSGALLSFVPAVAWWGVLAARKFEVPI